MIHFGDLGWLFCQRLHAPEELPPLVVRQHIHDVARRLKRGRSIDNPFLMVAANCDQLVDISVNDRRILLAEKVSRDVVPRTNYVLGSLSQGMFGNELEPLGP